MIFTSMSTSNFLIDDTISYVMVNENFLINKASKLLNHLGSNSHKKKDKMKSFGLISIVILVLATALVGSIPFTVHHNHAAKRLSGVTVSPNGKFSVYSIRAWDETTKKSKTNLEILDLTTRVSRPLTNGPTV